MTQSEHPRPTVCTVSHPLPRLDEVDIAMARRRHTLVELLERHGIAVIGSGPRRTARCPFHDDQSPSLSVYLDSNRYYCFACGARGDAIALTQRLDGLNFREAVARLNEAPEHSPSLVADVTPQGVASSADELDVGFGKPSEEVMSRVHPPEARQSLDLLTVAAALYQAALARSLEAQAYLKARGITIKSAQRMRVGYGQPGALRGFLGDDLLLMAQARAVGLLDAFDRERLEGRIVIPEMRDGHCLWMVGRTLSFQNGNDMASDSLGQEPQRAPSPHAETPKYLSITAPKPLMGIGVLCGEVTLTHRAATHGSRSTLSQKRSSVCGVIVVEGPFDLLAAQQWRLPLPCVALVGAYASRRQITELIALAAGCPIWLALDADAAGDAGAEALRAALLAARYVGPVDRLRPPLDAKDFGELAGVGGARTAVARLLAHPVDDTSTAVASVNASAGQPTTQRIAGAIP